MKRLMTIVLSLCLLVMSSVAMAASLGTDIGSGDITVHGFGVMPPNAVNPAQARMMARRAAVADAYRQLAEAVQGVNVDANTTVQNMMVVNDTINTKVSALVRGARIVGENMVPDGGYEVVVTLPVYGANGVASAVLQPNTAIEAFPAPQSSDYNATNGGSSAADPRGKATMKVKAQGDFTGVIIDCSGLGLRTAMSPVIMTEGGQKVYGYKNLDYQKVISKGMAGYVSENGSSPRAGSKPLILRAVSVDNGVNPVISQADADKMLVENQLSHFLDQCNVVFVR